LRGNGIMRKWEGKKCGAYNLPPLTVQRQVASARGRDSPPSPPPPPAAAAWPPASPAGSQGRRRKSLRLRSPAYEPKQKCKIIRRKILETILKMFSMILNFDRGETKSIQNMQIKKLLKAAAGPIGNGNL